MKISKKQHHVGLAVMSCNCGAAYSEAGLDIIKELLDQGAAVCISGYVGDPTVDSDIRNAQDILGRYIYELKNAYTGAPAGAAEAIVMGETGDATPIEPVTPGEEEAELLEVVSEEGSGEEVHVLYVDSDGSAIELEPGLEPGDPIPGYVNPLKHNVIIYLQSMLRTPGEH